MAIMSYGLKTLKFGECTGKNTMPDASKLAEKFETYRNSCEFTEDDPEIKEEYTDQRDSPVMVIPTKGKKTIKVSTLDYSTKVLQFLKGGTVSDKGQWQEPAYFPQIFKAVEITTLTGLKFACPKAQIIAKFTAKFTKEGGKLIEVSLIPMEAEQGKGTIVITPPAA